MRLLTESLDDPEARCGRCSVCRGPSEGLPDAADPEVVRTITATLRRKATTLDPRKMWPGGEFGRRGRIAADLLAEPGRVLAHADAPEWVEVLAAARRGDEHALAELGDAAVATLAAWVRETGIRADVIVFLRLTGTNLAETLAEHLRTVGKRGGGAYPVRPGDPPTDATARSKPPTGATTSAIHPTSPGRTSYWWSTPIRRAGRSRSPRPRCARRARMRFCRC